MQMEALEAACFPPPFPVNDLLIASDFLYHGSRFPSGQLAVEHQGHVVGFATSMVIAETDWESCESWDKILGDHQLSNHDPNGSTLFGVDICIHPDHRGKNLAKELYQARFNLAKEMNLTRYSTACRLPGLVKYSELSPTQFVEKITSGEIIDLPLTAFLRLGMKFKEVKENFMLDEESRNCSAILEFYL